MNWNNNTVAELIHGPADGHEVILSGDINIVETIEVPIFVDLSLESSIPDGDEKVAIRVGIYFRDSATLRLHTGAPTTVKFKYVETRNDTEKVE